MASNKGGAPKGNQNGAKGNQWKTAIQYALENYSGVKKGLALREIAKTLIGKALEGDMNAIKEIGDRLDGKPTQVIAGDPQQPLRTAIEVSFVGTKDQS
jgi:hypothetical protein